MNVDQLAYWYVEVIEPVIKIGAFLVLLIVVLHFINIMKTGGRSSTFVSVAFEKIIKALKAVVAISVVAAVSLGKSMLKFSTVIINTVKDFFAAKN